MVDILTNRARNNIRCVNKLTSPAILLFIMLCAANASAQLRIQGPRGISEIGSQQNFGISKFRTYSTSTESVGRSSSSNSDMYTGQSKLKTQINRTSASNTTSGLGRPVQNRYNTIPKAISSNSGYGSSDFRLSRAGKARMLIDPIATGRVALGTSMETTFGLTDSLLKSDNQIRSLAPDNQGQYATVMRSGEQAMKILQYGKAAEIFRHCNYLNDKLPDSMIAQAHANFALGRYSTMAFNLARAFERDPEIFSANLALRSFFGSSSEFIKLRDYLTIHCESFPNDAAALICKAYILWFDGERPLAKQTLAQASQVNTSPTISQTISAAEKSMKFAQDKFSSGNDQKTAKYTSGALTGMTIKPIQ